MRRNFLVGGTVGVFLLCSLGLNAQQADPGGASSPTVSGGATLSISSPPAGSIPRLVKFMGVVKDATGNSATGVVGLTFSLYELPEGGTPLWTELQSLRIDAQGRYTALLGANSPDGLPLDLFTSSKALWLGVQPQLPGAAEQPRVLLVAVPYALKASDADTVGGLPPSAFMLAPNFQANASTNPTIPLPIGFPPPSPVTPPGSTPPAGSIAGSGMPNFAAMFTGSHTIGNSAIYNSPGGWVGIGTTNPAATLHVNGTGLFNGGLMAAGLALPDAASPSVGVLTIGGAPFVHDCCGGSSTGNTFVGAGAGNFTTTGNYNTADGFQALYLNTSGSDNTVSGLQALYTNTTGSNNTANGWEALHWNNSGNSNTASGYQTLNLNTTGGENTASGQAALYANSTGSYNTAVGFEAGVNSSETFPTNGSNSTFVGANATASADNLTNATAIGYNSVVGESNALVLGGTGGNAVKVGIGTAAPAHVLDVLGDINASTNINAGGNLTVGGTITGSGMVTLSNANNTFTGNGSGLTNLNPASLSAGTAGINITGSAANALDLGGVAAGSYARTDVGNTLAGTNIFGSSVGFGSSPNSQVLVDINGTQTETSNNEVLLQIDGTLISSPGNSYSTGLGVYPTTTMTGYTNYNKGIDVSLGFTGSAKAHSVVAVSVNQPSSVNASDCVVSFGINVPNQAAPCATPQPTRNYGFFENGVAGTMNYFASPLGIGTATPQYALDVHGTANFTGLVNFASGQTFPGTGTGTVSSVGSGLGLTGGPIMTSGTLSIDTTVVPQLGAANTFTGKNIFGSSVGFGSTPNSQVLVDINGTQTETSNNEVLLQIDGTLNSLGNSYSTGLGVYPTTTMTGYTNYNKGIDVSLSATGSQIAHSVVAVSVNQPSAVNGSDCVVSFGINVPNQAAPCSTPQTTRNYGFFENGVAGTMNYFASPVGIGTATPTANLTIAASYTTLADNWTTRSSRRWKTNIQPLQGALGKVEHLRGVTYTYTATGKQDIGMIAEEVGKVVPEVVTYEANGKDAQGIDYSRLTAVLVEAVKEQQKQIQLQQSEIRALEEKVLTLESRGVEKDRSAVTPAGK